jgi:glycosyltransferase involved in cell wall biosynthesis
MDTGGGPLTFRRIIEDFPKYEYYVSGNEGIHLDYFKTILPSERILQLRGLNLPLNVFLLTRFSFQKRIDILHVHGRGAASFSRFVKLFIPSIKVIYTPNGFFPRSLPFFVRHIYILGERILFYLTDIFFFVSKSEEYTFASALRLSLENHKFRYIQNYIKTDLKIYKYKPEYTHRSDCPIQFLFIGRLSPQKGVDILVESLKIVKQRGFHLTIVGSGEMETYLKNEISSSELSSCVSYIGKYNDAFQLLPYFNALLLPSRFEGLPFTLLEAMHYRTTMIVTPCNGNKDLVDDQVGYISKEISAPSFAKCIDEYIADFYSNKEKIDRLKTKGVERILKDYSLQAVTEKMRALYQFEL